MIRIFIIGVLLGASVATSFIAGYVVEKIERQELIITGMPVEILSPEDQAAYDREGLNKLLAEGLYANQ